jgi:hypothetical protein
MGYFYFDETIQEKGQFIIGAFVYSDNDLTPMVYNAIEQTGLKPGIDEFKSSARMSERSEQIYLRDKLISLLCTIKIGMVLIPINQRRELGSVALWGLSKIVHSNNLDRHSHFVYFDEGITLNDEAQHAFLNRSNAAFKLFVGQDSKVVGGIQLADYVAHTLGIILLEQLGLITKKVSAGDNSGYDPDLQIEFGFELWATLRYSFFKSPEPK